MSHERLIRVIYEGSRIAPKLAVVSDPTHPMTGWIYGLHANGEDWVALCEIPTEVDEQTPNPPEGDDEGSG